MKKVRLEVKKITYNKQKDETTTETVVIKNRKAIEKLSLMCFLERYLNDNELMRIIDLIDEKIDNLKGDFDLPDDVIKARIDIFEELRKKVEGLL